MGDDIVHADLDCRSKPPALGEDALLHGAEGENHSPLDALPSDDGVELNELDEGDAPAEVEDCPEESATVSRREYKTHIAARPEEVEVLFDGPDFLAAHKPAHLVTHPSKPSHTVSLLGVLRERFPGQWLACVNRLDRETSGIVLVAKNPDAAWRLQRLWKWRRVEKTYEAIAWGYFLRDKAVVDFPIGAVADDAATARVRVRQGYRADGLPAQTWAWVRRRARGMTWFFVKPRTGRLHQIRVHLASLGHPIVGDKIYGPSEQCYLDFVDRGWTPELERQLWIKRHALHAGGLEFVWKNRPVRIVSPLPEDLRELWSRGASQAEAHG
jgi:23S rRNA pseudouridine1911/1915/1917 synthase